MTLKTKSGIRKRFFKTKSLIKCAKTNKRHNLSSKSSKKIRLFRNTLYLTNKKVIKKINFYI